MEEEDILLISHQQECLNFLLKKQSKWGFSETREFNINKNVYYLMIEIRSFVGRKLMYTSKNDYLKHGVIFDNFISYLDPRKKL